MDQLIIKNLELFAYHGVFQEEKNMGQKFVVDANIDLDLTLAGTTDNLEYGIHYGNLCHELQEVFINQKHDLIERAATLLCEHILLNYPMAKAVDLTLKKPWAPIHLPIEYPAVRLQRKWHDSFIALGSNIGDKRAFIEEAINKISASPYNKLLLSSTLIETEPFGYEDQDNFINGVIRIKTLLSPRALMEELLSIEKELKRERTIKWGPRTIDLDILYYDDIISDDEFVTIPHPLMQERSFVLEPLCEISPYFMHPIYRLRNIDLLNKLNS